MNNFYIWLIVGFVVLVTVLKAFLPEIKGWLGERFVSKILSSLRKEEYKVINNVMLKTNRGTTQIDHIVVSIYGIFVIETKNYKGWITGGEFSDEWTKNMYGKKYKFRNPLKQNYGHVKTLEELLDLATDKFIPIVVFSVNTEIKVNTKKPVVYTANLKKEILSHKEERFNVLELNKIVKQIKSLNVDSKDNRKKHVADINKNIIREKDSIANNICPKCGGTLIKRNGKYGGFMGCSNYPKCRYTVKLT